MKAPYVKPPVAAFKPQHAAPPKQRGDNGLGPLPKCAGATSSRHVNLDGKTGGGPKGLKGE